jgi:hypothetical protein
MERETAGTMAAQIAAVYAARGDADKAFAWLERARKQDDGGLADLAAEPLFRKLRGDPRFARALQSINLPPDLKIR